MSEKFKEKRRFIREVVYMKKLRGINYIGLGLILLALCGMVGKLLLN